MGRLRLSSSLLLSAVGDGYLAYDVSTGQLHRFNPIAALVAELCIGGRSLAQIEQDLRSSIPECEWISCASWIDSAVAAGWFESEPFAASAVEPTAEALTKLAAELREADRVAAAFVCQQHAARLAPDEPDVWRELGELAHIMDRREDAREAYERYDQLRPGDAEVAHLLVALRDGPAPARVSDHYLRSLYARFSSFYDESMVDDLEYRAPIFLARAVESVIGARAELDVLDLGCGTGLAAAELRPHARRLVGVDLSQSMVEIARSRASYDALHVAEVTAFLAQPVHDAFHLITACDTLIYFGDLRQIVGPASRWLRPGGLIAFTVERSDSPPFQLTDSGRFAHHADHIKEVAAELALNIVSLDDVILRYEYGKAVSGLVAVLEASDEASAMLPAEIQSASADFRH
jgi:predicted TPR repeat methyltransferase